MNLQEFKDFLHCPVCNKSFLHKNKNCLWFYNKTNDYRFQIYPDGIVKNYNGNSYTSVLDTAVFPFCKKIHNHKSIYTIRVNCTNDMFVDATILYLKISLRKERIDLISSYEDNISIINNIELPLIHNPSAQKLKRYIIFS